MEPQVIVALVAGIVTLNISVSKLIEYLVNKKAGDQSLPAAITRLAVLETRVKDHLENGPTLNLRLDVLNRDITEIKESIANIEGRLA